MTSKRSNRSNRSGGMADSPKWSCDNTIQQALATAESRCRRKGLRFTPVRRKVLELLLQEKKAIGAYEILERLSEMGLGSQPPVAYRSLGFLTRHGFAHKIERLNAFVACICPGEKHAPAFMICRLCDSVTEAHSFSLNHVLGSAAEAKGFQIEHSIVEAEGICMTCVEQLRI